MPPGVTVVPLPPCSPELNPAEHAGQLLRTATTNRVLGGPAEMERVIEKEMALVGPTRPVSAPWSATTRCILKLTLPSKTERPVFHLEWDHTTSHK
jgi:hypothetical protein